MTTLEDKTYSVPAMFLFTESMMRQALEANGWYNIHTEDYWVNKDITDLDHGGLDTEDAFKSLLRKCNLV